VLSTLSTLDMAPLFFRPTMISLSIGLMPSSSALYPVHLTLQIDIGIRADELGTNSNVYLYIAMSIWSFIYYIRMTK
jgi:hypothetical protein